MKFPKLLLALLLLAISVLSTPAVSQKSIVDKQKTINKQAVDDVKNRIDRIKKELVAKNNKFRVEVLEVTRYKISQITGLKKPVNIESDARQNSQLTPAQYRKFLRRLKELGLLDAYFSSLDTDEEESAAISESTPEPVIAPSVKPTKNPIAIATPSPEPTLKPSKEPSPDRPSADLAAFSWLNSGKLTPVKNQKQCGSCWTFASAAVIEASVKIIYGETIDISEQSILDCSKATNGQKAGSCETGGWYGTVFGYYQKTNLMSENKNPYKGKNSVCVSAQPLSYRIGAWSYVRPDAGTPDISVLKKAIAEHGAIAGCVKVTEAFQAYAGGIYDEYAKVSGPNDVNHAITIIGWDDSKKAWLIKNSWGPEWGENGYMWIEYGCNNIGYGATWAAVEKTGN
jgi:C1A family cysteine protease